MKLLMRLAPIGAALLALSAPAAIAADIVDQEQTMTTTTPFAIGGDAEELLAQSFTLGMAGEMTHIRIPVACSSGELIVEIQRLGADGLPNGDVVTRARVPAADIPPPLGDFVSIYFSPPVTVSPGEKYAIVLSNPTGECGMLSGPAGDSYPGGQFFYDARPDEPGWIGGKDRPAVPDRH